jgi:chaperonin GroES
MAKTDKTKTTKINLKPAAGYLLIEPKVAESKTAGGIYLPENATGEKPQEGTILAVGADEITDGGAKKPSPVEIGDKVIYKKWGGNEVKVNGVEYLFVKFEDILAIVA